MKKLIEHSVEGAKILDLCVKGDELLEEGTGAVFNKPVKGVKVNKGMYAFGARVTARLAYEACRHRISDMHIREQRRRALLASRVRTAQR